MPAQYAGLNGARACGLSPASADGASRSAYLWAGRGITAQARTVRLTPIAQFTATPPTPSFQCRIAADPTQRHRIRVQAVQQLGGRRKPAATDSMSAPPANDVLRAPPGVAFGVAFGVAPGAKRSQSVEPATSTTNANPIARVVRCDSRLFIAAASRSAPTCRSRRHASRTRPGAPR